MSYMPTSVRVTRHHARAFVICGILCIFRVSVMRFAHMQ